MRYPLDNFTITQGFSKDHLGIDLASKSGTPILAPESGVIDGRGDDPKYIGGFYITMRGDSGNRYYMGHNSLNKVGRNQRVAEGQHIANVGATGTKVTGPHVHFQVWDKGGNLVDPRSIIKQGEDMFEGKTAQQWANEAKYNASVAKVREDMLNRIAFAAGDDLDAVEEYDVQRIIANIDAKNKRIEELEKAQQFVPLNKEVFVKKG